MRRLIIILSLCIVSSTARAEMAGKDIVDRMVKAIRGNSNIAEYTMEVHTPSWTRDIQLKVWDDRVAKKVFVKILGPAKDAGTTFLRLNYNLWMYMPSTEKVMKIPPSMMLQPWMGSDFTNDDLVKESSYTEDYDHTLEAGDGNTYVVRMDPKPGAPVVWGKMVVKVRRADFMPIEQGYYNEKGALMKTLHFSNYKVIDGHPYPMFWKMENATKPGKYTTITLKTIAFNTTIPAETFTEQNLRK